MFDVEGEFSQIAFNANNTFSYKMTMRLSRILGLDYGVTTFLRIVELLERYKIPATFFTVGALFLKDTRMIQDYFMPRPKTHYISTRIKPWGEHIEKIRSPLFEFGIHNFFHESNFMESDEQIQKSLTSSIDAAKRVGKHVTSYAAPWFELEDERNPERIYRILRESGITSTRFDGAKMTGKDRITHSLDIKPPFSRHGMLCINSSYLIKDGIVNNTVYDAIRKGIHEAIQKNGVFAISTHDTTFARHGLLHLENILKIFKEFEGQISFARISELHE